MLIIDETWNNREAEVSVGDSLKLALSENPTTGYRWRLCSNVEPALRILDDSFETASEAPGSSGVRRWTLEAERPATLHLRLELKRSWEPRPIRTFAVMVVVKAR